MSNATFSLPTAFFNANIADGYVYECSCGELYNQVEAAYSCRKCRNYCVFGYCTHVVDVRDGSVVAGEEPSVERYEEAAELKQAEWDAERAEYALWMAMQLKEGEIYEAEIARLAEEAKRQEAIDKAYMEYAIQDSLMGIRTF